MTPSRRRRVACRLVAGGLQMLPRRLSKLNAALLLVLLLAVLAAPAGVAERGPWIDLLIWAATVTVGLSGARDVIRWDRRAVRMPRGAG